MIFQYNCIMRLLQWVIQQHGNQMQRGCSLQTTVTVEVIHLSQKIDDSFGNCKSVLGTSILHIKVNIYYSDVFPIWMKISTYYKKRFCIRVHKIECLSLSTHHIYITSQHLSNSSIIHRCCKHPMLPFISHHLYNLNLGVMIIFPRSCDKVLNISPPLLHKTEVTLTQFTDNFTAIRDP